MSIVVFLLLAVMCWTFARCARICGDMAKDLRNIQARQRQALREVEAELLLDQFGRN